MFRRYILQISSRPTLRRNPRRFVYQQIPLHLSLQKNFSTASKPGVSSASGSPGKPPESNGTLSKFFIGSVALGAAFLAAYQTGYLDQYLKKEHYSVPQEPHVNATIEDLKSVQHSTDQLISPSEKFNHENPTVEITEQKIDAHFSQPEIVVEDQVDKSDIAEEVTAAAKENQLPEHPQSSLTSDDPSKESVAQSDGIIGIQSTETDNAPRLEEGHHTSTSTQTSAVPDENGMKNIQPEQLEIQETERRESALGKDIEQLPTLLEEYQLRNKSEKSPATYISSHGFTENSHFPEGKEALSGAMEELKDGYISENGKLVLDFLQAIHAAEKRQADLDARVFSEEKKVLKEKYEKKLKDAAARELMLAEEAAMLDRELKRERAKASLAINSLQEKMEEKLKTELEQKEIEAELKLKQAQELAKAELNAAIANEKAAQIEKMAEANVNINALCMAFYARSEEARQSHATQNFALRALALEDALSKGLPIETEIASLQSYLGGIDKDSILDLVLASLPEETRSNGTDTQLQLKQKASGVFFDALKGSVRHFSFFPPGGGGMLAHSLAHLASWLKVREDDQSGDGIESVINKVEVYLAEGKLAEAADCLEESVRGTQAAEIVAGWVRQARNRAISEQAVLLLQSYANSLSLT
ncbi:MICOS complex subunit MIC60 [Glycine soja]